MRDVPSRPPRGAAPAAPAALHFRQQRRTQAAWAFPTAQEQAALHAERAAPAVNKSRPLRITVLGKSPSWQDADGACSGYLVEEGDHAVLLDCGNGVFGKLRCVRDYVDIDAVVISHLHADHFLDLVPYAYALTYAPRQQPVPVDRWPGTTSPARPRLVAPAGARQTLRRVVGAWGNEDLSRTRSTWRSTRAADRFEVGGLHIRFHEVPHYLTTHAIEISVRRRPAAASPTAPTARPTTRSCGSPRAPTC